MEKYLPHIDELIAKHLDKSASPDENLELLKWRQSAQANEQYFNELKFVFETSSSIKKNVSVDTNAAWQRLNEHIQHGETNRINRRFSALKIAASVILFLAGAYTVYYFIDSGSGTSKDVALNTEGKSIKKTLPDGSKVQLEANSSLAAYGKNSREYVLTGQATFTVKHNEEQPFIIHAHELSIKDVGTVFTVNAENKIDSAVVSVSEGSVEIYTDKNKGLLLVKGETGIYYYKTGAFKRIQTRAQTKLASMNFVNTTLEEVVYRINKHFKSNVVIDDYRAGNCLITVRFNQSKFDDMILIITETLGLEARASGNKIILTGNSCAQK